MKRKFKSILCALLCLALAFSLSACKKAEQPVLQVAALKGPTGLGLSKLMTDAEDNFEITLYDAPDAVTGKFISGEIDIAAVPINLASVLYSKTQGQAVMIAVRRLVESGRMPTDEEIAACKVDMADFKSAMEKIGPKVRNELKQYSMNKEV